jgi:Pectinacetylesterase
MNKTLKNLSFNKTANNFPRFAGALLLITCFAGLTQAHTLPGVPHSLRDVYMPPLVAGNGPARLTSLWKIPLPDALYPDARCGDGSIPVFYVRAAPVNSIHRNDWVFSLPGGGSFSIADSIIERWLGVDKKGASGPTHLSTHWAKKSMQASGIHNPNRIKNQFADFNHVHIDKCTLDLFTGTTTATLTTTKDITDITGSITVPQYTTFDVEFRGRKILEGIVDYLRNPGLGGVSYFPCISTNECQDISVPSLDDAENILWSGSSGGGKSVIHSADMVFDMFANTNANVKLVVDAAHQPGPQILDDYHNPAGNPAFSVYDGGYGFDPVTNSDMANYFALTRLAKFLTWNPSGSSRDHSCLAYHAGVDEWKCTDETHVLMNHIATAFFVRQDQFDAVYTQQGTCWWVPWATVPGCYTLGPFSSVESFAKVAEGQMQDLINLTASAEEVLSPVAGFPSISTAAAGFSPRCSTHVALTNDKGYFVDSIFDGAIDWSFSNRLEDWYFAGAINVLVEPTGAAPITLAPTC